MPSYDESCAECFVLTFKEGLLSPVAHDLRLVVGRFRIDVEDAGITARFDTSSLRVDAPMKDGSPLPGALSAADKDKIAAQIRDEVLHASRYPEARFTSSSVVLRADGGHDLTGSLTLHGVTRVIHAQTRLLHGRQGLELALHQPDFGIAPFKAMLGTLKVQPDVKVLVVV
ncbi:MAG: YceI family protein [Myxococcales bacterium]|nr:MAG: YceI family protein [Myxococcales bacterium]